MSLLEKTEAFIRDVWERGDNTVLSRSFTPDARIHGLEEMDLMGPAEFAAFHRMVIRQFTQLRIEDVTGVEQGDRVALAFRIHATEVARKRPISVMAFLMVRYDGERICEGLNFLDFLSLFEQAGRLPTRTRDMCLLGNELKLTSDALRRAH